MTFFIYELHELLCVAKLITDWNNVVLGGHSEHLYNERLHPWCELIETKYFPLFYRTSSETLLFSRILFFCVEWVVEEYIGNNRQAFCKIWMFFVLPFGSVVTTFHWNAYTKRRTHNQIIYLIKIKSFSFFICFRHSFLIHHTYNGKNWINKIAKLMTF